MKQWSSFYSISLSQIPQKRKAKLGLNKSNLKYWAVSNQILGVVTLSWGFGVIIGVSGLLMAYLYGASLYSHGVMVFSLAWGLLLRPNWIQLNSILKELCEE